MRWLPPVAANGFVAAEVLGAVGREGGSRAAIRGAALVDKAGTALLETGLGCGLTWSTGARPLAMMADRCHILLVRERGLRIGRRQYRGTILTLANPAANELAWLIAKLHADPAIDPGA